MDVAGWGSVCSMQVLLDKKSVYAKPVDPRRTTLSVDKFGGVVLSWSRFGGSLKDTLLWASDAGLWDWRDPFAIGCPDR